MSPLMKIGKLAFPSSHPASCYSRGNGRDRRPTPKTLSRKLSFVFGENNTTSRTVASSTRRCDPLRLIFSGATADALEKIKRNGSHRRVEEATVRDVVLFSPKTNESFLDNVFGVGRRSRPL